MGVISMHSLEVKIDELETTVESLQTEADDLGTMLYDFLGVEECQPFKSHINVDLPIRYFREGYISPDLRIIKNIQVGDWVNVEGIGLIQIIGENKRGTNTIRISDAGRDGDRHTYLKKVSWIR